MSFARNPTLRLATRKEKGRGSRPGRTDRSLLNRKRILTGYQHCFSDKKAKRTWKPNAHKNGVHSMILNEKVHTYFTTDTLRTIDKMGGIDNYILKNPPKKIDSEFGEKLRKRLEEKAVENQIEEERQHIISVCSNKIADKVRRSKKLLNWEPEIN